ncbi:related to L-ornithine N5-oxygenase SidA [Rhynchosporium agropyri]|uniref:L-ornithine N(5)-monooxygenase [NAD(P)H] n=1 Tax=Rhynchosporium agropyri TaxID=914238 RepID=A0A1E1KS93_9HELO|nr:related to L-ornithine N5-oxygenase SidA [Rhynchosporium agropyri]
MASNTQEIGDDLTWSRNEQVSIHSKASPQTTIEDLICIGFGPASLAIAIALSDASSTAKVSFLERQPKFAWHAGMQLPGAKMQISFMKDLATPRNPQSKFTFINYLFSKKRLNTFINLDTFLPSRLEYEDYLRWCAGHFEERVRYGQEVVEVSPDVVRKDGKVTQFQVVARDIVTGELTTRIARHVVIAVGGKGRIPSELPQVSPRVVHSSKYSQQVSSALPDRSAAYNIAVLGSGQSAAEIFNDLPARYPNAKITMVIKGSALRPSDDSPFVNEVFDPERVDGIFAEGAELRASRIKADKATNYGVVRLGLLEHLYERFYMQRLKSEDERDWQVKMRTNRKVVRSREVDGKLLLTFGKVVDDVQVVKEGDEELLVDAVFVATGYERNAHEGMLVKTRGLLTEMAIEAKKFSVRRDYKIAFDERKVAANAGVWLQGCNESTHGLSDTLLSILAVRGGELVQSIFGNEVVEKRIRAKL